MSFHYGNILNFYRPDSSNRLVTVGLVTYLVGETSKSVCVSCFTGTGSLFMNGKFSPSDQTIGETLGWFIGEQLFEIDIEDLFFQNGKKPERPAHHWERGAFYMGRWKQYAKTDIRVRATIRVTDRDRNESIHIDIPDQATIRVTDRDQNESVHIAIPDHATIPSYNEPTASPPPSSRSSR